MSKDVFGNDTTGLTRLEAEVNARKTEQERETARGAAALKEERDKNLVDLARSQTTRPAEQMMAKQAEKDPADAIMARGRELAEAKRGAIQERTQQREQMYVDMEERKRKPSNQRPALE